MSGEPVPSASESLAAAVREHQAGRTAEAEALYRQALAADPQAAAAWHGIGLLAYQGGRPALAAELIGRAVALQPGVAAFHMNLGAMLRALGRLGEAAEAYRRAIALKPDFAAAHFNLANTLNEQGLKDEALASYRDAATLAPDNAEAHHSLAVLLEGEGRAEEAEAAYRLAVAVRPAYAPALNNLGDLLMGREALDEAEALLARAVAASPDHAEALYNLGRLRRRRDETEAAADLFARALAVKPGSVPAADQLGQCLVRLGRLAEAEAVYRSLLAASPEAPKVLHALGDVLQLQGRLGEAEEAYAVALAIRPDGAVLVDLGSLFMLQDRLADAIAAFEVAAALDPPSLDACNNLGVALFKQGRMAEAAAAFARALALQPGYGPAAGNRLLCRLYDSDAAPEAIFAEHRLWGETFARSAPAPHANDRDPERRLRIGYASPDFRTHSVAYFLEPLLGAHDRARVEVFAYAEGTRADATTARLRGLADHWRQTQGESAETLAGRVRADRIDILIDLAGHSAANRLDLFALKPAPVQATWLGYPDTTGLAAIDYRIVDAITDPPGEADVRATEILVRLDGGFLCYAPPAAAPEPAAPPSLSGAPFAFGSFNNPAKLSDRTVAAWAAILTRLPDARLVLKGDAFADPLALARHQGRFASAGVDPARIAFRSWVGSPAAHLGAYAEVDVALDPFPYNGATTTCEALWMGVPVVALAGERHAGRVGASLLHGVGLDSLVAADTGAYVEAAVALAGDPARLAELRAGLRARMAASPLCDAPAFARRFEAALRAMWRRWCAGLPAGPL